jgi:hypothetical protein
VPNAEQEARLSELAESVHPQHWTFPQLEVVRQDNAPLFTYAAMTSEKPEVVAAALHAIQVKAPRRGLAHMASDPDTLAALEKHLDSQHPRVLVRALALAKTLFRSEMVKPELTERVLKLAEEHRSGVGRYAVLDALSEIATPTLPIAELATSSLGDAEPATLSGALEIIIRAPLLPEQKQLIAARAAELLQHDDPGVRGRALIALALLDSQEQNLPLRCLAALSDENPHVRAQAAMALDRIGKPAAIHHLITLVHDQSDSLYKMVGWKAFDGQPGKLTHRLLDAPSVAQAAKNAILSLAGQITRSTGAPILGKDKQDLDRSPHQVAALFRAWYTRHRHTLPTFDGVDAPPIPPAVPPSNAKNAIHAH